jgi:hypothetical protein
MVAKWGKPPHTRSGNAGNGSLQTLSVFLFFGRGLLRPVALVAGVRRLPVLSLFPCAGEEKPPPHEQANNHATSGLAANDQGTSPNANNGRPEGKTGDVGMRRCGPTQESPCQGNPRTPLARGLTLWRQAM